jgi:hypothetical protein
MTRRKEIVDQAKSSERALKQKAKVQRMQSHAGGAHRAVKGDEDDEA